MVLINIALLVGLISTVTNPNSNRTYQNIAYHTGDYGPYLSNSTIVKDIQFENYKFEFQDNKLPEFPVSKINVITENEIPILFELNSVTREAVRSYFYGLNSDSNKLFNYYIEGTKFQLDTTGLKYYTNDTVSDILDKIPNSDLNLDNFKVDEAVTGLSLTLEVCETVANNLNSITNLPQQEPYNNVGNSDTNQLYPSLIELDVQDGGYPEERPIVNNQPQDYTQLQSQNTQTQEGPDLIQLDPQSQGYSRLPSYDTQGRPIPRNPQPSTPYQQPPPIPPRNNHPPQQPQNVQLNYQQLQFPQQQPQPVYNQFQAPPQLPPRNNHPQYQYQHYSYPVQVIPQANVHPQAGMMYHPPPNPPFQGGGYYPEGRTYATNPTYTRQFATTNPQVAGYPQPVPFNNQPPGASQTVPSAPSLNEYSGYQQSNNTIQRFAPHPQSQIQPGGYPEERTPRRSPEPRVEPKNTNRQVVINKPVDPDQYSHVVKLNYYRDSTVFADFKLCWYMTEEKARPLLTFPNKITLLSFNNNVYMFDPLAILPESAFGSSIVYTCKHKLPIMMIFYLTNGVYCYSPDKNTGNWTNYKITQLSAYEKRDKNGATYYKTESKQDSTDIYNVLAQGCLELAGSLCITHKETNVDLSSPPFELFVTSSELQPNQAMAVEKFDTLRSTSYYVIDLNYYHDSTFPGEYHLFSYYTNQNHQSLLRHPNQLASVTFNNILMTFDDNSILPNTTIMTFDIYTCKHKRPILVILKSNDDNIYCYSIDQRNLRWNNYRISQLTAHEKRDSNGAVVYTCEKKNYTVIYNGLSQECLLLSRTFCAEDRCGNTDLADKHIKIKIKLVKSPANSLRSSPVNESPREISNDYTVKPSTLYIDSKNHPYLLYSYDLNNREQHTLKHPNKLERMKFNGLDLVLHDRSVLPELPTWSVDVLTCRHNIPVVIELFGPYGYVFFGFDTNTGRWINYRASKLKAYETVDKNGVTSYKYGSQENALEVVSLFYNTLSELCIFFFNKFCQNHQNLPTSQSGIPEFELKLKLFEVSQIIQHNNALRSYRAPSR